MSATKLGFSLQKLHQERWVAVLSDGVQEAKTTCMMAVHHVGDVFISDSFRPKKAPTCRRRCSL
jgi:hypothetical protein